VGPDDIDDDDEKLFPVVSDLSEYNAATNRPTNALEGTIVIGVGTLSSKLLVVFKIQALTP